VEVSKSLPVDGASVSIGRRVENDSTDNSACEQEEGEIMNPADPKIEQAIQHISAVYSGQDAAHAYYDPANKLYVLVVSGQEAESYQRAVKAIHSLATKAVRLGRKKRK